MAVSLFALAGVVGCNDKNDTTTTPDMTQVQAGPPDMGCYADPKQGVEFLNSCLPAGVTIDQIDKNPTLPLLNPDGTRPALP
jgi:hypothetical protein